MPFFTANDESYDRAVAIGQAAMLCAWHPPAPAEAHACDLLAAYWMRDDRRELRHALSSAPSSALDETDD